ncbi:hypothetical protein HCN44_010413 [Aphidius gifuensis]|uniref:Uncharacterized protein n=1 Tax=Aphidius gifuensis TaxID=684658 RepID=A0A834XKW2_APHGI|nr:hypothetical protein HCN44_010413 [Aphidius gifuensis]
MKNKSGTIKVYLKLEYILEYYQQMANSLDAPLSIINSNDVYSKFWANGLIADYDLRNFWISKTTDYLQKIYCLNCDGKKHELVFDHRLSHIEVSNCQSCTVMLNENNQFSLENTSFEIFTKLFPYFLQNITVDEYSPDDLKMGFQIVMYSRLYARKMNRKQIEQVFETCQELTQKFQGIIDNSNFSYLIMKLLSTFKLAEMMSEMKKDI